MRDKMEVSEGFIVEWPSSPPVEVRLEPWNFRVFGGAVPPRRIGLLESRELTAEIAMRVGGISRRQAWGSNVPRVWKAIIKQFGEATLLTVQAHRDRVLRSVPPRVLAVHAAVLRATGHRKAWLAETEDLYKNRYLVKDILRYRAAAIAVGLFEELWRSPYLGERQSRPPVTRTDVLEAIGNWRGLFSPDGKTYTSLDRTLMNLPERVPARLVCALPRLRLDRPITNRLELMTLCLRASISKVAPAQMPVFAQATEEEIRRALKRVGDNTRRRLDPGRLPDIQFALDFIAEYRGQHYGRLGGLVEKAIRWHEEAHRREMEDAIARMDLDEKLKHPHTPTARPRIPLPAINGIRFLETAGEVVEEGRAMRHCVAWRAGGAVRGQAFLFHVEFQGERATVEVLSDGTISQSAGPRNSDNPAARWGAKKLRAWAASGLEGGGGQPFYGAV